ncbi:hypothetical protein QQ020_00540 [Fulvivirgaceae bacterium BMA12]|uniref:Phage protein n=1 Tax=Agaribacillus aureus TaxID=3051825 RepID=A0ABT8L1Y6_9BACT|nr:hypothetical protein [Fulvivirgaceae bacterium BMA12]
MHKKLKILFDEDQYECMNQPLDGTPEYKALRARCKHRISQVKEIIKSSSNFSGEDYFNACIIFMHGDCPDDFRQAYHLALKSVDLNYEGAKRFAAAAYDRWLMYRGKPQKFGLQYVPDGVRFRLWDVAPETTDEERAEWDVPTLQELYRIAEQATKNYDMSQISMETKPQWLKDAIKRWNSEGG